MITRIVTFWGGNATIQGLTMMWPLKALYLKRRAAQDRQTAASHWPSSLARLFLTLKAYLLLLDGLL